MAENDIYGSKEKYESFKDNLNDLLTPLRGERKRGKRWYYCKNKANIEYFKRLFSYFEAKDLSYVRRLRLIQNLKLACFATDKDLKVLDRDGVNEIVAFMHSVSKSSKTKSDFIRDIKYLWKIFFPEKDAQGRADDSLTPYAVRHLSPRIDKSREKRRDDRFSIEEFEQMVTYFSNDVRIQAFLTLSLESLGRPQELLYTKIKDCDLFDSYAKINISEHGKEGTGILQCIDSFPYLQRWLEKHPLKNNPNAFLFINLDKNFGEQLRPENVNKTIRQALRHLKIARPITCYSLKRNGVTMRRLRGESDAEIQHAARWTSSKQLKTYDKSNQEDALKIQLAKRGIIKDDKFRQYQPERKVCLCGKEHAFSDKFCDSCKRPLDREGIKKQIDMMDKMERFIEFLESKPEIKTLIENAAK